jgi:hypothetical protein
MLHRSAETATYPGDMAKVELNLPDDLLRRIDRAADRAGETREEFLQRMAQQGVAESKARFRKEMEEMLPTPIHGGGGTAEWLRWDRDHRDDKRFGRDRKDD